MAVPVFNSVEEADAFLDAPVVEQWPDGPVTPSTVDIAPEDPTPLLQLERPLDGAIEPNVQEVLDENGEPPLPTKDGGPGGPALPQADEDLPPVTHHCQVSLRPNQRLLLRAEPGTRGHVDMTLMKYEFS